MLKNRPVRIIKRDQRGATAAVAAPPPAKPADGPAASEREIKTVVSGWVNEHRRRADEFRQAYTTLLKGAGFNLARG